MTIMRLPTGSNRAVPFGRQFVPQDGDKVSCPSCGTNLPLVQTAYGFRLTCMGELIRFTWIRGDDHLQQEAYNSPGNIRTEGTSA